MATPLLGGFTLLMVACEERDFRRVSDLLPSTNVNARNNAGATALILAAKANDLPIARLLLSNGASVDCVTKAGQSALFVACCNGSEEMVATMLEAGADTNCADKRGWTPLMAAVHQDSLPVAQLLLRYGCSTSALDAFGKSAFDRIRSTQMRELLERFASEQRNNPTAENVRRSADKPLIRSFSAEGKESKTPSSSLSMRSIPAESEEKTYENIPAGASPEDKRKFFREALAQEVRRSAAFVSRKLESEYFASLHAGLKQKLAEIDKSLRDDLQFSLERSKVSLRTSLKSFASSLISSRFAVMVDSGHGNKSESMNSTLNARDNGSLPYFHSEEKQGKRATALRCFLEDT